MKTFAFEDYKEALKGAGPKLKDIIIQRAIDQGTLEWYEIKELIDTAFPDQEIC